MSDVRRARFSVLAIFSLVTIAALVTGLAVTQRRNAEFAARLVSVRAENARLRAEQGVLTINDPTRVHAVRMPQLAEDVWRYRVHLPAGRSYYVAAQANGLPTGTEWKRLGFRGEHPGPATIASATADSGAPQIAIGADAGQLVVTVRLTANQGGDRLLILEAEQVFGGPRSVAECVLPSVAARWPKLRNESERPGLSAPRVLGAAIDDAAHNIADPASLPLVLVRRSPLDGGAKRTAKGKPGVLVWVGRADE
ncbi:MAG: hypothetical protein AAF805_10020 [Planctomycetota bacterium]